MSYTVYILRSSRDDKRYIGFTSNLDFRLKEHAEGGVKATKNRRPLNLEYIEIFDTKEEAEAREKYFKSGRGRIFLNRVKQSATRQRTLAG